MSNSTTPPTDPNDLLAWALGLTGSALNSLGGSPPPTSFTGDNQTFNVTASATVTGSNDNVILGNAAITLTLNGNSDNVTDGTGADTIIATGNGNAITGGSGTTNVTSSGTNNQIALGAGVSTVVATGSGTTLTAAAGGSFQASLTGDNAFVSTQTSGTLKLTGSGAIINLGAGNDVIGIVGTGGPTNNVFGGSGTDTYALETGDPSLPGPVIHGFKEGTDKLAILVNSNRSPLLSQSGLAAQTFVADSQFEIGTRATAPSTRFVYDPATGNLSFTPYGAVTISALVAQLPTNLALKASDLFISNAADSGASTQSVTAAATVPAYTPPPTPPTPAVNFGFFDAKTGVSSSTQGEVYQGPVNYLQYSFIKTTADAFDTTTNAQGAVQPDAYAISAKVPNVFITATGGDALASFGGQNVLSGGPGSNFLVGTKLGQGTDTFFTDARTGGQVVWNTVENFHAGDMITLWGFVGGTSTYTWVDNEGAAGYTGVTLRASLSGNADPLNNYDAKITLTGLTRADLATTTISTGNVGNNNPYLAIVHN